MQGYSSWRYVIRTGEVLDLTDDKAKQILVFQRTAMKINGGILVLIALQVPWLPGFIMERMQYFSFYEHRG